MSSRALFLIPAPSPSTKQREQIEAILKPHGCYLEPSGTKDRVAISIPEHYLSGEPSQAFCDEIMADLRAHGGFRTSCE